MDSDNLIEFTSPSNSPYTVYNNQIPIISSNPFDEPPINYGCPNQFVSPSKINFEEFDCNFLRESSIGRESLLKSENYGRESLGILDLDDIDIGRESLGIERLKITKRPTNDLLNQALLYTSEDLSNTSVFDSINPSFESNNSNSLKHSLYSLSSIKVTDLTTLSILNKRINNTTEFYDRLMLRSFNHKNRILSLPDYLPIDEENDGDLSTDKLWKTAEIPPKPSKSDELDPVLMEARHLADCIDTGSIFNEELNNIYSLEHTTQPNLVDNSFNNSPERNPQKSKEINDQQHNSNSLTTDPRELLNSLSQIINTNNQQKSEGQLLLNSLANILLSKSNSPPSSSSTSSANDNNNQFDDSGNASIDHFQQAEQIQDEVLNNECFEVLDLRLKTSQDTTKSNNSDDLPLDLSINKTTTRKEHEFLQPKFVVSKSDSQKNTTNNSSRNLSLSQNENHSYNKFSFNNSNNSQLKIKKNDEKKRTGPLKAVIPIDNMMKTPVLYNTTTPITSNKSKKTSTPVNEPKMKPMAQSTPATPSNGKWKLSPVQSLNDQNQPTTTDTKCRLNYSDSNQSSDQSKLLNNQSKDRIKMRRSLNEEQQQQQQRPQTFLQRRSLTDLKQSQISRNDQQHPPNIQRSYSAGKDPKILSSIRRVRQSINKNDNTRLSRSYSADKAVDHDEKNKFNFKKSCNERVLNENKTRIGGGNIGKIVTKKTFGKENLNR